MPSNHCTCVRIYLPLHLHTHHLPTIASTYHCICVFIYLPLYLCTLPTTICVYIFLPLYLCIYLPTIVSVYTSTYHCICVYIYLSLHPSTNHTTSLHIHLQFHLSDPHTTACTCTSTYRSVFLQNHLPFHLCTLLIYLPFHPTPHYRALYYSISLQI